MQEYKYNYQDWVEGNILPHIDKIPWTPIVWKARKLISVCDYEKINKLQKEAYKFVLDKYLQEDIWAFLHFYNDSFIPIHYLESEIERVERDIAKFKEKSNNAIDISRGHENLSYNDVQLMFTEEFEGSSLKRTLIRGYHPFSFILFVNYLQWLKWFKNYEIRSFENEQNLHFQAASRFNTKEELTKSKISSNYTWPNLFLDIEQASKILALVSEYISDSGQWLENGRTLVALYAELKQKGYLKQNLSGEKVANALNKQFGTDFDKRNFQPADLLKAESYKEQFTNLIPPYLPGNTSA